MSSEIEFGNFQFLVGIPSAQIDGTLLDQPGSEAEGVLSQEYEVSEASMDSWAADDFAVPSEGAPWYLSQIVANGNYVGNGPASLFNISILHNAGGIPGGPACTYVGLAEGAEFVNVAGNPNFVLPEICSLNAGQYWLAIQADMDSAQGSWLWNTRLPSANSPAQWQNPGEGQGQGCSSWTSASSCFGFPSSRDLGFTFLGPSSCGFHSTLDLRDASVTIQRRYDACLEVRAGDFEISGPAADVIFSAGQLVVLENGFTVGPDARFTAEVGSN
jgi:hypothetical protein